MSGLHSLWQALIRLAEKVAVTFSHEIIADNQGIAKYVENTYRFIPHLIAYGGDHALDQNEEPPEFDLPEKFSLALCRIEPENNVHMILEAFSLSTENLVFIGN